MKKNIFFLTMTVCIFLFGCEKFTEIEPKGRNLLSTDTDLDLLLNDMYSGFQPTRTASLTSGIYLKNLALLKNEPVKSFDHAVIFWDETVDRAAIRPTCNIYEPLYSVIGKTCNPVISRADAASGDRSAINRYKAEAYVLRAWFHYLAVNIFAKAYDPVTAATDGGVPYALDTDLLSQPSAKYTVAEVYDLILQDLDRAFALGALSEEGKNSQRVGKSFAHAVHARVLLSMRRFDEALTAARVSLAINAQIDDHNEMLQSIVVPGVMPNPTVWARPQLSSQEDLFNTPSITFAIWLPKELMSVFDVNSVYVNHAPTVRNLAYPTDLGTAYFGLPGEQDVLAIIQPFSEVSSAGLTSVDMHLTEAECLLRQNNLSGAKAKLEEIRKKRVITDRYAPAPASSDMEVFALLKQLSRSENWFTFKDIIDLKRWNSEAKYATDLNRTIMGETYTLKPDSPLWIYPFPQSATNFNAQLTQNY